MDAELANLATSGARTIVARMTTDAWQCLRDKVARIFTHSDRTDVNINEELEASRHSIVSTGPTDGQAIAQQEQDRWEARIRLSLIDNPTVAALITDLIDAVKETAITNNVNLGRITIRADAKGHARVYQQGYGTQHND